MSADEHGRYGTTEQPLPASTVRETLADDVRSLREGTWTEGTSPSARVASAHQATSARAAVRETREEREINRADLDRLVKMADRRWRTHTDGWAQDFAQYVPALLREIDRLTGEQDELRRLIRAGKSLPLEFLYPDDEALRALGEEQQR